jgi:hypothetical protein
MGILDSIQKMMVLDKPEYHLPLMPEKPTIRLIRVIDDPEDLGTFGVMVDPAGKVLCRSGELSWDENKRNTSCIPPGVYDVEPHESPKFGKCFLVQGVPGRSDILIHSGNWCGRKGVSGVLSSTEGCILPGARVRLIMDVNAGIQQIGVTASKQTLTDLLAAYPKGFTLIVEGV